MARKSTDSIELFFSHHIELASKTIYLGSDIGADGDEGGIEFQSASSFIKGLMVLDAIRPEEPIKIVINNFGGEDDHCRAMLGAMRMLKSTTIGVVLGRAESAAAWVFQACDLRVMDMDSNLMLHMGYGNKDKHSRHLDEMFTDKILDRIKQKHPSYSRKKLIEQLHEDWYIYPQQAVELGLADEVLK